MSDVRWDITAEVMEEVFICGPDIDRLDRLTKRLGKCDSEVVAAALKFYEDALNAVDESRNRPTSMSFEVFMDAKV